MKPFEKEGKVEPQTPENMVVTCGPLWCPHRGGFFDFCLDIATRFWVGLAGSVSGGERNGAICDSSADLVGICHCDD